jgi:hypothetical protein
MKFVQNYSLMLFKSVAVILFCACTFASCKKDKEEVVPPVPVSAIIGKWAGSTTYNGAPTGALNFVIKTGGVIEAQNGAGQKVGEGTWQLNNVAFTASYTITVPSTVKYNFIGTLENSSKLSGAYGTGNSQFNGGFWNVAKQP